MERAYEAPKLNEGMWIILEAQIKNNSNLSEEDRTDLLSIKPRDYRSLDAQYASVARFRKDMPYLGPNEFKESASSTSKTFLDKHVDESNWNARCNRAVEGTNLTTEALSALSYNEIQMILIEAQKKKIKSLTKVNNKVEIGERSHIKVEIGERSRITALLSIIDDEKNFTFEERFAVAECILKSYKKANYVDEDTLKTVKEKVKVESQRAGLNTFIEKSRPVEPSESSEL